MDKKFIIILIVAVIALGGIFAFSQIKSKKSDVKSTGTVSNNSIGVNSKNVEIVEYGDFQCPSCGQYFPIVEAAQKQFANDIKFTFRHFPLTSIHKNALAASRAAEAAGKQGKFFEMYALLYRNQQVWSEQSNPITIFQSYAEQLGLNMNQYNIDFASEVINDTINADVAEGTTKGVTGTPTFYINGKKLDNKDISSLEALTSKINEAIASSAKSN
jgi:protein-disulfide isomerase